MLSLDGQKKIKTDMEEILKKTKIFSTIRLVVSLVMVVFGICYLSLDLEFKYLLATVIASLALLIVVVISNPTYRRLKFLKNLEYVYNRHDYRRKLQYRSFLENGRDYLDKEDYKELDLDILGPSSLYQYLCIAKSSIGKSKLAKQLTKPEEKSSKFSGFVKNLAEWPDFFKLELALENLGDNSKDPLEVAEIVKNKIKLPLLAWFCCAASYILLVVLAVILVFNRLPLYYLFLFIPLNFLITKVLAVNDVYNVEAIQYANVLANYKKVIKELTLLSLDDPVYKEIQTDLTSKVSEVKSISKILDILSFRRNWIFSLIANGLFFFDFFFAIWFNRQSTKEEDLKIVFDQIGELELAASLAIIGVDNQTYCLPKKDNKFSIKGGYHPLVSNCVPNDFSFSHGVILTGSNMAGKTTFMRMLGVNQILGQAGGLVCAEAFSTPKLEVMTSLRANDMLQEGISTFHAEINRMRVIMDYCRNGGQALVLIDEIFKGTNAKDRIYASLEIIKTLTDFGVYFIISTHDFELCEAPNIVNYHFDEEYSGDDKEFDYKIKKGRSETTNALHLLRLAGVLRDLQ